MLDGAEAEMSTGSRGEGCVYESTAGLSISGLGETGGRGSTEERKAECGNEEQEPGK